MSAKEHPILFSTPMVQAILEGRKTQTRRVINPQPEYQKECKMSMIPTKPEDAYVLEIKKGDFWFAWESKDFEFDPILTNCSPYGQIGDNLWVRETFKYLHFYPDNGQVVFEYRAGGQMMIEGHNGWVLLKNIDKWKPSIHMPKAACRLWLTITDIRVERLQDITEENAVAEGVEPIPNVTGVCYKDYNKHTSKNGNWVFASRSFQSLWDSINGKSEGKRWQHNPWVWVITYEIDQERSRI